MHQEPVTSHEAPIHSIQDLSIRPPEQLFGRDSDLASIRLALQAGTAILLQGPAGIGKTALAAVLAEEYTGLPGGVLWLDVAEDSLRSLLNRVAQGYATEASANLSTLTNTVRDILRAERPLIVLDGNPQLDGTRDFIRLCASGLPVVITSSQLISGPWTPHVVNPLDAQNAEAMLAGLANRLSDTEIIQFSQALGGHPLSIVITAHQLASGKIQPGDFLSHISGSTPAEVMDVLMTVYRALSSTLQGMVLLVGTTFARGASEELLADSSGAPAQMIRTAMRQLVGLGLASEWPVYGQPYFTAHELIQDFAHAFLRGKGQLDTMVTRHLRALLTYIQRHEGNPDRLAAEKRNILAAGRYAALHNQSNQLNNLIQLLEPATTFQPELNWLRYLIEHPESASDGLLVLPESPLEETAPEPIEAPVMLAKETPPQETIEEPALLAEEFPIEMTLEEIPPQEDISTALLEPIDDITEEDTSRTPVNYGFLEETEPVAAETAIDPVALREIAKQELERGSTPEAIAHYIQALETFHANGDVSDELEALDSLAALSLQHEDYDKVLAYIDRGTALAQQINNPQREAHLLVLLGDLQMSLERDEGAEAAYKEAINAYRPTESWLEIAQVLDKLSALYLEQDRLDDAAAILEQTIPIFERGDHTDDLRMTFDRLGDIQAELMNWDEALSYHVRAFQIALEANDDRHTLEQLTKLGGISEESGDREGALPHYQQALHLAFQLDDKTSQGEIMLALGRLLIDDTVQMNRVAQLLEGATERLPDNTEAQRLLNRAKARAERLTNAGVTLLLVDGSIEDYAREAAGISLNDDV